MAARSSRSSPRARDIRYIIVYGYARLVGYDEKLELKPDILESVDNEDDRIFTFTLRDGPSLVGRPAVHDRGFPLLLGGRRATTRSCRRPAPPEFMLVDGKPPQVRGPGRAHGPLHLGQAQPALPAALAGPRRPVHLPAGPLPQAVPRQIRRQGEARGSREEAEAEVLGGAAQPHGRHVRERPTRTCRRWSPGV